MFSIGIQILIILSVAAWLYSAMFLLLTIENRRHWKGNLRFTTPPGDNYPRVCVMVPCKGIEARMKQNLASLLRQNHPNFQVLFVVESFRDPAVHLIRQVMAENPIAQSEILVAGKAINCGQKVHNLCRAIDSLEDEIDIYAFADCDAAAGNMWLRWLVDCIGREGVGARTGYRWMKPGNKKLPTLLACTANNALAAMMGRGGHHLIWGGSWAIHRSVFRATGIREAWEGVVSDDLVASRALRLAKLKILFAPQCLCLTTVEYTWTTLLEFFRRQLLITRCYSPTYWTAALLTTIAVQVAFWGGVAASVSAGLAENFSLSLAFACSAAGLYMISIIRAAIRQNMGRKIDSNWRASRSARNFDLVASPLTGIFVLTSFLSSCIGNTLTWRGNHYHLGQGGTARLLGRSLGTTWPVGSEEYSNEPLDHGTGLAEKSDSTQEPIFANQQASLRHHRRHVA